MSLSTFKETKLGEHFGAMDEKSEKYTQIFSSNLTIFRHPYLPCVMSNEYGNNFNVWKYFGIQFFLQLDTLNKLFCLNLIN